MPSPPCERPSRAILASELKCDGPPPTPFHWQNPDHMCDNSSLPNPRRPSVDTSASAQLRRPGADRAITKKPGQLFTNYFLEEGILYNPTPGRNPCPNPQTSTPSDAKALALLKNASNFHTINEASTEQELIRPLFELLGWVDYLPQQGSDHNEDIPDHLLSRRRRIQRPRLRQTQPESLPRRPGCRREQALQPASRRTRQDQFTCFRPDPPLSCHRRHPTRTGASAGPSSETAAIPRLYDRRETSTAPAVTIAVNLETALHAADGFHRLRNQVGASSSVDPPSALPTWRPYQLP